MIRTCSLLLVLFLTANAAFAQDANMANVMRDNGKIYVVVGVIVLIFAVLFAYLVILDRKLRKLEREIKEK